MSTTVTRLQVGDDPADWAALGFMVDVGGACRVGSLAIELVGRSGGAGITGWTLAHDAAEPSRRSEPTAIDGIPTTWEPSTPANRAAIRARSGPDCSPVRGGEPAHAEAVGDRPAHGSCPEGTTRHPAGCVELDHLVATTSDLEHAVDALHEAGFDERRRRDVGGESRMVQVFLRGGPVIVELVGPQESTGSPGTSLWGLAFAVSDLDAAADRLGAALGPIRPAVQPGRRIATVRHDDVGLSMPVALMTPRATGTWSTRAADPLTRARQ